MSLRTARIAVLVFLFPSAAPAAAPSGEAPAHCGPKRPVCLHYALTRPEFAFLLATKQAAGPDFMRDYLAYSGSTAEEKDAMVRSWRARIKKDAARALSPSDPGRARLGQAYLSGRNTVARGRDLLSSAGLKRALAHPKDAAEPKVLAARLKAVEDYAESLAIDDITFLSLAGDESDQTDDLGRWIEECLRPAGGLVKAARGRVPACRRALGGLPPMDD